MYDDLWKMIEREISGEKAREYACRIYEHDRWFYFKEMEKTAQVTSQMMREVGLQDVELIETPADGETSFGGWVNPEAWDVEDARLEIVEPAVKESLLAHYRQQPYSLMQYSTPTPAEGFVSDIVVVEHADQVTSYSGKDVKGKVVLVDKVGINTGEAAFDRGAAGIISDALETKPFIRTTKQTRNETLWHNYTIPPWKTTKKGFGFSITPARGKMLRQLITDSGTVKVRAVVKTKIYKGKLCVVTGVLAGTTNEEIAITGHLYEPGADDNASGCGLGIEVARSIGNLIHQGKVPRPKRSIRLIFGMEVRGMQAFLALSKAAKRLRAGINIDMVGFDQNKSGGVCSVDRSLSTNPAYTEYLMLDIMERLKRINRKLRLSRIPTVVNDNVMSEPMVNAPCTALYQVLAAHHHISLDTPDKLSPLTFHLLGTAVGTYCLFLSSAGFKEALWLVNLCYDRMRRDVLEECESIVLHGVLPDKMQKITNIRERFYYLSKQGVARIKSVTRLVPGTEYDTLSSRLKKFVNEQYRDLEVRLKKSGNEIPVKKIVNPSKPAQSLVRSARKIVPEKIFYGFLGWESIKKNRRKQILKKIGETMSWSAPGWVQTALFCSNGKRDLFEIWKFVCTGGETISLDMLVELMLALEENGFVRFC